MELATRITSRATTTATQHMPLLHRIAFSANKNEFKHTGYSVWGSGLLLRGKPYDRHCYSCARTANTSVLQTEDRACKEFQGSPPQPQCLLVWQPAARLWEQTCSCTLPSSSQRAPVGTIHPHMTLNHSKPSSLNPTTDLALGFLKSLLLIYSAHQAQPSKRLFRNEVPQSHAAAKETGLGDGSLG